MFKRIRGGMIPVFLLGAVLALGLFSAGCENMMEDTFEPLEPEEVEENENAY